MTRTKPTPKNGPQKQLDEFWDTLIAKTPGKITTIFPVSLYANLLPHKPYITLRDGRNCAEDYEIVAQECRDKVKRIVRDCQTTNERFTDPDFDIEKDLASGDRNCLRGLVRSDGTVIPPNTEKIRDAFVALVSSGVIGAGEVSINPAKLANALWVDEDYADVATSPGVPPSVHRLDYIYDNPQFTVDGFSSSDVVQGSVGDCWWISAVATMSSTPGMMDRCCVARNEECGVYGFVFYRDGQWISTIIDDNLYMRNEDFDDSRGDIYDPQGKKEASYKKRYQTGSESLYYARCADENETWLPLLEKAYAKVHGDYDAIAGGFSGDAVEDMTGGVCTSFSTSKILSKNRLWEEIVNKDELGLIFGASTPSAGGSDSDARRGLALCHAYSIRKAVEPEDKDGKKVRLVLIRNPWGQRDSKASGEWNGPWSDGSREWTPYWLEKLNYRFGDDGEFYMSYDDFLKRFDYIERTRVFDKTWSIVQRWTAVNVAWASGYLNTKFVIEVKKEGQVVIVLQQLDHRYFKGLVGQYSFDLHFLLSEPGAPAGEHIARARTRGWIGGGERSVSVEVDLKPGKYEVLPKISAERDLNKKKVEDQVKTYAEDNPQKLRQIGLNYDLAHARVAIQQDQVEKPSDDKAVIPLKAVVSPDQKMQVELVDKPEGAEVKTTATMTAPKEVNVKVKEEAKEDGQKEIEIVTEAPIAKDVVAGADEKSQERSTAADKPEEASEEKDNSKETGASKKDPDASASKQLETPADTPAAESNAKAPAAAEQSGDARKKDSNDVTDRHADMEDGPTGMMSGEAFDAAGPIIDQPAPTPAAASDAKEEDPEKPAWNAVCVVGLRVYSRDPEATIDILEPKDDEEAAELNVDGNTAAGATM